MSPATAICPPVAIPVCPVLRSSGRVVHLEAARRRSGGQPGDLVVGQLEAEPHGRHVLVLEAARQRLADGGLVELDLPPAA